MLRILSNLTYVYKFTANENLKTLQHLNEKKNTRKSLKFLNFKMVSFFNFEKKISENQGD